MSPAQVRAELRKQVKIWGSQRELARVIGITPSALNYMITGRREPFGKAVAFLGLERKSVFVRKYQYTPIADVKGIATESAKCPHRKS